MCLHVYTSTAVQREQNYSNHSWGEMAGQFPVWAWCFSNWISFRRLRQCKAAWKISVSSSVVDPWHFGMDPYHTYGSTLQIAESLSGSGSVRIRNFCPDPDPIRNRNPIPTRGQTLWYSRYLYMHFVFTGMGEGHYTQTICIYVWDPHRIQDSDPDSNPGFESGSETGSETFVSDPQHWV